MRHEPVEPGHAAIVEPLHPIAHRLRGDGGLLGDAAVGGARAHDRDEPDPVGRRRLHDDQPRERVDPALEPARAQG